jgi:hypothetical protein
LDTIGDKQNKESNSFPKQVDYFSKAMFSIGHTLTQTLHPLQLLSDEKAKDFQPRSATSLAKPRSLGVALMNKPFKIKCVRTLLVSIWPSFQLAT